MNFDNKLNIISNKNKTMVIAIFGGSNSGKTTLASIINKKFDEYTMIISQDRFYYGKNNDKLIIHFDDTNYDHPKSIAFNEYVECLKKARSGQDIDVPIYDF